MRNVIFVSIVAFFSVLVADGAGAQAVPRELLVTLRSGSGLRAQIENTPHLRHVVRASPLTKGGNVLLVATDSDDLASVARDLRRDQRVAAVQPNYVYRSLFTPDDPSYVYQWNLSAVNAPAAWDFDATPPLYGGDPSVVVAVLDTGVSYEDYGVYKKAPDFVNATFVAGTDLINGDAHPNDDHGHGTHVAMTIAESTNNALSSAGIAFSSSIMPVKVLDADGLGTTATIAAGIDFARTNGAQLINLSLGGTADDPVLHTAVQNAANAGVVLVAAAGNDGTGSVYYPARYDEVIAVGATRYDNTKTSYSNYGTGLDLVAPGGDISVDQNGDGQVDGILQQTCNQNVQPQCSAFADYYYEGTSQATPHVTAAAALLLAAGVQAANVTSILEGSATDLGVAGYDTSYGWGLLNISQALSVGLNDTTSPVGSVTVNAGAEYTTTPVVTLNLSATDVGSAVAAMAFSNDGVTFSLWETYATTRANWTLATGDGPKTVYAQFKDAAGNVSAVASDSVTLDTQLPTLPALTVYAGTPPVSALLTSGMATASRSFTASWVAPADATSGVAGYRVSLSPNANPDLSSVALTTEQQFVSPVIDSPRTLYLHVLAQDRAGNTSEVTTFTYVYQPSRVVAAAVSNDGTVVILSLSGKVEKRLKPYGNSFRGGVSVASVAYEPDKPNDLLVAPHSGGTKVRVLTSAGKQLLEFVPYGKLGRSGISVVAGNTGSAGAVQFVTAPRGERLPVRIFDSRGKKIREFWPFGKQYGGGISLALATVDRATYVAAGQMDGTPLVRIFSFDGKRQRQFYAFSKKSAAGVSLAAGDVNGDGNDELLLATASGTSQVRVVTVSNRLLKQFFAFGKKLRGGVRLAAGDYDGNGVAEIFAVPASGVAQVSIFDSNGRSLKRFFGFPKSYRGGANLTTIR